MPQLKPWIPALDSQQDESTSKYEALSTSRPPLSSFPTHLCCFVLSLPLSATRSSKVRQLWGASLDAVSLRQHSKNTRGHWLARQHCMYVTVSQAAMLFSVILQLDSHNPNRVTIVEMLYFFFLQRVVRVIVFWRGGGAELNWSTPLSYGQHETETLFAWGHH